MAVVEARTGRRWTAEWAISQPSALMKPMLVTAGTAATCAASKRCTNCPLLRAAASRRCSSPARGVDREIDGEQQLFALVREREIDRFDLAARVGVGIFPPGKNLVARDGKRWRAPAQWPGAHHPPASRVTLNFSVAI